MSASRILTLKSAEGDIEIPIAIFAPMHQGRATVGLRNGHAERPSHA
jgi:hypothetical protein